MKQKYRRYLLALKDATLTFGVMAVVEIALLLLLLVLNSYNLLDIKTIISVILPEVGIGILLYYLLGQKRRSQIEEAISLLDACDRFSHLLVYSFSVFLFPSVIFYYVANTQTKEVYQAPKYIVNLTDQGIIHNIKCKNEKEMKEEFVKEGFNLNDRNASIEELKSNEKIG